MRVAVCVVTFQRPEGLRRLLESLQRLTFRDAPPDVEIVVVDNEPGRSAESVCDAVRAGSRFPIRCEVEPRRGIPFARNKAVACAVTTSDHVAFIDDDEEATPGWLDELLRVQRTSGADVVTGPVEPIFPDTVPDWIRRGRFFESRRRPTGSRVDVAYTNNVLVASDVFRGMDPHFDETMALAGGTDAAFFRRVHRAGRTIVWADDAVVRERIPPSRTCAAWLVRRAYRTGVSLTLGAIRNGRPWRTRLVALGKAGVWLVVGLFVSLFGLILGRVTLVKGLRWAAFGAGTAAGVVGKRFEEYRTIHGA